MVISVASLEMVSPVWTFGGGLCICEIAPKSSLEHLLSSVLAMISTFVAIQCPHLKSQARIRIASLQGMYTKTDTPKVPGQSTYSSLLSFFLLPSTPFPHSPAFFPHVIIPHACCQPNLGGGSARVLNGLAPCLNRFSSFLFI